MARIDFQVTKDEFRTIQQIVKRAVKLYHELDGPELSEMALTMDLSATHRNGCPLDLERLYQADDFNFLHDVSGILRHIDRKTGQLTGSFLPRFARSQHLPTQEA